MILNTDYGKYDVGIRLENYVNNNNTCISLYDEDGCPFAIITTNIEKLPKEYACIDTNNYHWATKFLTDNDLGEPTECYMNSGFCTYPIYKLNLNKLKRKEN